MDVHGDNVHRERTGIGVVHKERVTTAPVDISGGEHQVAVSLKIRTDGRYEPADAKVVNFVVFRDCDYEHPAEMRVDCRTAFLPNLNAGAANSCRCEDRVIKILLCLLERGLLRTR